MVTDSKKHGTISACALQKTKKTQCGSARKCENGLPDTRLFGFTSVPSSLYEPLIADTLVFGRIGDELSEMHVAHFPSTSALWMVPSTSPYSPPVLVAKVAPVVRVVTESAWCCHSVQAAASGKCVRKAWRRHGHSALPKHVDQIKVGRDKRLGRAVGHQGFDGAPPVGGALASAKQTDAPLVHAQGLGAKGDLMLIDEPFGIGRPQELAHLDGSASRAACA